MNDTHKGHTRDDDAETIPIYVNHKTLAGVVSVLLIIIGSFPVVSLVNQPDTSDRYYGHQGRAVESRVTAAEQRIRVIEKWIDEHRVFMFEQTLENEKRLAAIESQISDLQRQINKQNNLFHSQPRGYRR